MSKLWKVVAISVVLLAGVMSLGDFSPVMAKGDEAFQAAPTPAQNTDNPYDLKGALPTEDELFEAIGTGIDYLLGKQRFDGSWDQQLLGQTLSKTADEAVDAVSMTSLCGLALRTNSHYDPNRVEPAVKQAADYVMDRIQTGKLSTKVQYAIWRYVWGIRFLTVEYKALGEKALLTSDEKEKAAIAERQGQMKKVCQMMLDQLIGMQLFRSGSPLKKVSEGEKDQEEIFSAMPTNLGIRVEFVNKSKLVIVDGRKQNVIIKGVFITGVDENSAGADMGLQANDRLMAVNDVPVETEMDYYEVEVDFRAGQTVSVMVERNGEVKTLDAKCKQIWPGTLGVKLEEVEGLGVRIKDYNITSAAKLAKLKVNDYIKKIGDKEIKTLADYEAAEAGLLSGQKSDVVYRRESAESDTTVSIVLAPKPRGTFGEGILYLNGAFGLAVEDSGHLPGALVGRSGVDTPAKNANIYSDDRITHIGNIAIRGLDHFRKVVENTWVGQKVDVTFIRGTTSKKMNTTVTLGEYQAEAFLGITVQDKSQVIKEVTPNSPADKAGFKANDKVVAIGGKFAKDPDHMIVLIKNLRAGQLVKFHLERGGEEIAKEVVMGEKTYETTIKEEGGWNYYFMGVATSFVTAATLNAMLDLKAELGVEAPAESLEAAFHVVEGFRSKYNGEEGYVYRSGPATPIMDDVRGHIGRISVCELACVKATDFGVKDGKGPRSHDNLAAMLETFLKYRDELDRVRNFKGTHFQQLWNNAAYYWMFGHYHSALATHYIKGHDDLVKRVRETCLKAVMADREKDGTWLGHHAFGKITGTAEALMVFGQLHGVTRLELRDVCDDAKPFVERLQNRHYAAAYIEVNRALVKAEDETLKTDLTYLKEQIEKIAFEKTEKVRATWILNPPLAVRNGRIMTGAFSGIPAADQMVSVVEGWEDDPAVSLFTSLNSKYQDVMDFVNKKGTLLLRADADQQIKILDEIVQKGGDFEVAKNASAAIEGINKSYEGKGFLGVTLSAGFGGPGAKVEKYEINSPAFVHGVEPNDVIVKMDGATVNNPAHFEELMGQTKVGQEVEFEISRPSEGKTFTVKLALARNLK